MLIIAGYEKIQRATFRVFHHFNGYARGPNLANYLLDLFDRQ